MCACGGFFPLFFIDLMHKIITLADFLVAVVNFPNLAEAEYRFAPEVTEICITQKQLTF